MPGDQLFSLHHDFHPGSLLLVAGSIQLFFMIVILPLSRPNNTPRDRHANRTRERGHIAPTPSIRAVTPRATWHKHITRNKPPRKGLYTRKARGRRTLALEQQLHLLLHRGHNNATRPVMHQTSTPPHRVRDAVAPKYILLVYIFLKY